MPALQTPFASTHLVLLTIVSRRIELGLVVAHRLGELLAMTHLGLAYGEVSSYGGTSIPSRLSTIRSAALPSHIGGIAPFFHWPATNRASAGGSLLGSGPMSSLVPIVMVSGRSVLSRRVRHGGLPPIFVTQHLPLVRERQ